MSTKPALKCSQPFIKLFSVACRLLKSLGHISAASRLQEESCGCAVLAAGGSKPAALGLLAALLQEFSMCLSKVGSHLSHAR